MSGSLPDSTPPSLSPSHILIRYFLHTKNLWNPPTPLPLHLIPEHTQSSVIRFYHLRDRKLALGSQILQRLVICQTYFSPANTSLQDISIWKDPESGRPSYKQLEKDISLSHSHSTGPVTRDLIDYNVSHHSNLVAIAAIISVHNNTHHADAVGQQHPATNNTRRIGIDIVPRFLPIPPNKSPHQHIKSYLSAYTDLSSKVFTPFEIQTIESPPNDQDKIRMLYLHWALKEAYVKAVGTGLVTDLQRVEFRNVRIFDLVDIEEEKRRKFTDAKLLLDGKVTEGWDLEVTSFRDVDGDEDIGGYYVAVAMESEGLVKEEADRKWVEIDLDRDILLWDGKQKDRGA